MITILPPTAVAIAQRSDSSAAFVLISIVLLLALLVYKEFFDTGDSSDSRRNRLAAALNIGIVPLLITLSMIIVARIVQALV